MNLSENTLTSLSRIAAVCALLAAVLAVLLLVGRGAATGSSVGEPQLSERAAPCLLGMRGAAVALEPAFTRALARADADWTAIAPARATGERRAGLLVRGASGVPCSANRGVIGMRGGVAVVSGDRKLELRRWRLVVESRRIAVSLARDGDPVANGLAFNLAGAERLVMDGRLSLTAPVALGPDVANALNRTFGTTFGAGEPFGRLRIWVREVRETS
jgi:hypothetical protein